MGQITDFHAHVYFDADSVGQARELCEQAAKHFELRLGRVHQRPLGPHPQWSCQLAFMPEVFGELIPWLSLHRGGLTVFIHPQTGDELADHTEHALWMGKIEPLVLSALE